MSTEPPPPPQVSPDGKFYWDGTRWVPMPIAAAPEAAPVVPSSVLGGPPASDWVWKAPPPQIPSGYTAPRQTEHSRTAAPAKTAGIIVLVGCGIAVVGTFLPWLSATGPFGISVSKAGIEGDGKLVAGLALICAALAAFTLLRRPASFLVGLLIVGLGVGQLGLVIWIGSNISNAISSLPSDTTILASVGPGLYMSGLGAIIGGVGGIVAWSSLSSTAAAQETPEERDARITGRR